MIGRILKFARSLVSGIINQIMAQVNFIQEAVTSPLQSLVNQVVGGAWKGNGANRFVDEMTSEVIPMLVNIAGINNNYADAIKKSMERIEQAERQATAKAQQLVDVFSNIY
jgi:hypothetical protein